LPNQLNKKGKHCSLAAAWGDRTRGGELYSLRNLDWISSTGINRNKLIAVYHPTGRIAHATIGFSGLMGALAGMSSKGITVHEAGNDVDQVTFLGFQWSLRLRYVMEYVTNIDQGKSYFQKTNNTMGINHMVASAIDASYSNDSHPAWALETMAHYTAYFQDNDPREANAMYHNPKTGVNVHIGAPLRQAVWRTNHGYDPNIVSQQTVPNFPASDSVVRYFLLSDAYKYYEKKKYRNFRF